ncbi:MAG: peptide chain release factor N(5)-glutamine methyltransferase, partial [Lachnospiraceae bacterium]|nr:peptide chain release factor N(5)-glutamine methyltransferase [Lachnospiraceae bacterium]
DVKLAESDLFAHLDGRFDMIVSNPPYIARSQIELLQPEVSLHDPHMALDGGVDGLDFYRRIACESSQHLLLGGWLVLEIGHDQAKAVQELLRQAGFEEISVRQDLCGLDRVVAGRLAEMPVTDGE